MITVRADVRHYRQSLSRRGFARLGRRGGYGGLQLTPCEALSLVQTGGPNHWTPSPTPATFCCPREELSTRTLHGTFHRKIRFIFQIIISTNEAYLSPIGRGEFYLTTTAPAWP